ncbi:hypothetical protein [Rhodoferax antarcticus]|uniref:hypothetical protein n=1 Tax=Rhodoferax antarcticus TaxID=81479 RepID=UPI00094F6E40|nr:hypothetical protein [Rhodoferax antarcticus]
MKLEQIQAEWGKFIEYPTAEKTYVTTASALLFAQHIAEITAKEPMAAIERLERALQRTRSCAGVGK